MTLRTKSAGISVSATADALMRAAADRFVTAAAAIDLSDRFVVVLAGGSTPKGTYQLLATPAYASRVDWSRVHVFWSDERCLPPTDAASNFQMAHTALLAHVSLPAANIHRIRGEDVPGAAATTYEDEMRSTFATPTGPPRSTPGARFDLVLLGMGDNGHTASLFPGLAAVRESERWAMAEYVAEASMWRVTLTPVILNAAVEVVFLVSGSEKAATLQQVVEGPYRCDVLPAQAISASNGCVTWLVDEAAAANLKRSRTHG